MRAEVHGSSDQTDRPSHRPSVSPERMRRWSLVLLAAAGWNVWLWITRVWNLANDPTPRTTGFIVVHAVLYVVSFGFAIAIGIIGWRMWQSAKDGRG